MSVSTYRPNIFSNYHKPLNNLRAEKPIDFNNEGHKMSHTSFNKDDIINQFWSMTNDIPKENQLSLAASVVATKIFDQGITHETKNFLKNISNRFTAEEINLLKTKIKNHLMIRSKANSLIEKFMNDFDAFLANQQSKQIENHPKQQANPKFFAPKEIFFQTTFLIKPITETAI